MLTSNLGVCEKFVVDVRKSNLIERGQLDQLLGDYLREHPRAEPNSLADYLVHNGHLTLYQSERILKGKPNDMVMGPYVLMDALGTGSMGTVYKAQNKADKQWYAVKVLPRRSMWNVLVAKRIVRSFEQCRHPVIVPFMDVGTAGGNHYLVWPFVEGESLDRAIEREGPLAPGMAAFLVRQMAEGLHICHQRGLVHGMLKPSNLMVDAEQHGYILDFGIGALLVASEGESIIDTQSMANTQANGLDCVSPESIMDPTNLTPAGDQYSLGCVLYYCLTGQYPFAGDSARTKMQAHRFEQARPIQELTPDTPADMIEVVECMMKKSGEERYPSMEDVVNVLGKIARTAPMKRDAQVESHGGGPARPLPTRQSLRDGAGAPTPLPAAPTPEPVPPPAPRPPAVAPRPVAPPPPAAPPAAAPRPVAPPPAAPRPIAPAAAPRPVAPPSAAPRPVPAPAAAPRPVAPAPAAAPRPAAPHAAAPRPAAPHAAAPRPVAPAPAAAPRPAASPAGGGRATALSKHAVPPPPPGKRPTEGVAVLTLYKIALRLAPAYSFRDRLRAVLPGKRRADRVDCTLLAPPAVVSGAYCFVHLLACRPEQLLLARELARCCGQELGASKSDSVILQTPRAMPITLRLQIPDLGVDNTHHLMWRGFPEISAFKVPVPSTHAPGSTIEGELYISQAGISSGTIQFELEVVDAQDKPALDPVPIGTVKR